MTAAAQGRLDAARPRLQEIETALNRLEAEAATLAQDAQCRRQPLAGHCR